MKVIVCENGADLEQVVCREFLFPDGNPDEWRGVTVFGENLSETKHLGTGTLCRETDTSVPVPMCGTDQGKPAYPIGIRMNRNSEYHRCPSKIQKK